MRRTQQGECLRVLLLECAKKPGADPLGLYASSGAIRTPLFDLSVGRLGLELNQKQVPWEPIRSALNQPLSRDEQRHNMEASAGRAFETGRRKPIIWDTAGKVSTGVALVIPGVVISLAAGVGLGVTALGVAGGYGGGYLAGKVADRFLTTSDPNTRELWVGLISMGGGIVAGAALTVGGNRLFPRGINSGSAPRGSGKTLFRAVDASELADIVATGRYRATSGGTEGKYFFDTAEQASNFAKMMGNGPYTTTSVEVSIPELDSGQRIHPAGEGPGYFFDTPNIPAGPISIANHSVLP